MFKIEYSPSGSGGTAIAAVRNRPSEWQTAKWLGMRHGILEPQVLIQRAVPPASTTPSPLGTGPESKARDRLGEPLLRLGTTMGEKTASTSTRSQAPRAIFAS